MLFIRATTIGESDMLAGIVLAKFYLAEALRLFGKTDAPKPIRDAQELSDWLAAKWDEEFVSVTVISSRGPTNLRSRSDDIKAALDVLVRHSHVSEAPNGAQVLGKTARKAWRVHVGR